MTLGGGAASSGTCEADRIGGWNQSAVCPESEGGDSKPSYEKQACRKHACWRAERSWTPPRGLPSAPSCAEATTKWVGAGAASDPQSKAAHLALGSKSHGFLILGAHGPIHHFQFLHVPVF